MRPAAAASSTRRTSSCERAWAAVFEGGNPDFGEIDDTYLHGNAPGKMGNSEHRMPGLPVRLPSEGAGRHAEVPSKSPAECLGAVEAGVE